MMCHSYVTKWKKRPGLSLFLKDDMLALLIQRRVCLPSPLCSLADSSTKSPVNSYDCYSSSPLWTLKWCLNRKWIQQCSCCLPQENPLLNTDSYSLSLIYCLAHTHTHTHTSIICVYFLAYVCTQVTQPTLSICIISGCFCLHTYTCIYTPFMDTFSDSDWNCISGTFTNIS